MRRLPFLITVAEDDTAVATMADVTRELAKKSKEMEETFRRKNDKLRRENERFYMGNYSSCICFLKGK